MTHFLSEAGGRCGVCLSVGGPESGMLRADTLTSVNMRRAIQSPVDGAERQFPAVVTALAMHPQGGWWRRPATTTSSASGTWKTERCVRLAGHTDWIRAMAFSPDGKSLVSAGNDRRVLLWDIETGSCAVLGEARSRGGGRGLQSPGKWVATAGFEGQALPAGFAARRRRNGTWTPAVPTFAPGQFLRTIATSRWAGGMVRSVCGICRKDRIARTCHVHRLRIRGIAFAQEDQQIITGSEDRTVRIWNWQTDEQVTALPPQPSKILGVGAVRSNQWWRRPAATI